MTYNYLLLNRKLLPVGILKSNTITEYDYSHIEYIIIILQTDKKENEDLSNIKNLYVTPAPRNYDKQISVGLTTKRLLFSSKNNIPIYGYRRLSEKNDIIYIWKNNEYELIPFEFGCDIFFTTEIDLLNIMYRLGIPLPNSKSQVTITSRNNIISILTNRYQQFNEGYIRDKIINVDSYELEYYYIWLSTNISKSELCNIIIKKLKDIDHYFRLGS
jgi:hypothetical protein